MHLFFEISPNFILLSPMHNIAATVQQIHCSASLR
uniref:Uncharacterized protein n=1 Tax=Arundo donax TaxID=35708 RepID=A0A0A9HQP3_ARUDO